MVDLDISLPVVFPFRLDLTVWALRRRKNNIIDRWDGHQYTRIILFDHIPVKMTIAQEDPAKSPWLRISMRNRQKNVDPAREHVLRVVNKTLGLNVDLRPFYKLTEKDAAIGLLVRQFSGVKPPRYPGIFEALLNAIACQQVSLDVGIILLDRLAEKFGRVFDDGNGYHSFPSPESLADTTVEEIKKLGFSYQKARAINELAAAVTNGEVDPESVNGMSDPEAIAYLSDLRGIGRWSAEYVLLRGMGRMSSFPADDIGARNNLQKLFGLDHKPGYDEIKELTSRWHPYEGLVYFHLLLNKLRLNGVI